MINTGAIANLLRPGLREIFGESPSYPTQYTQIYKTYTSQKDYEQDQEMKMLGSGSDSGRRCADRIGYDGTAL
jgi:hypothetical protein